MKNKLITSISLMILICTLLVSASMAQSCAKFKGRTYTSFRELPFDNFPFALSGILITFDARGYHGTARSLTTFDPKSSAAEQQYYTVDCGVIPGGQRYFKFTIKSNGGDGGAWYYKSYDNGRRVLVRATIFGRDAPGWLLKVPPIPANFQRVLPVLKPK